MKNKLYVILIAALVAFTAVSCAEEEIKPKEDTGNTGGSGSQDPIKKGG
jgi:hypothetical protein